MQKQSVLSRLPDGAFLSRINLAGTHDSATAFVALKKWARCQSLNFPEQLGIGIRLFDIRLCKSHGNFYLVHSLADCYRDGEMSERLAFDEVLKTCEEFLRENPREAIVMSIKKDRGLKGIFDRMFFSAFYNRYIAKNDDLWFCENRAPTLGECRGKIVLMRRCKSRKDCGLDFSVWKNQRTSRDTELFDVRLNEKYTAAVQDSYSVPPHKKWDIIRHSFESAEPSETRFAVHFLSTSGGGMNPSQSAEIINNYFEAYELKADLPTGWILLDFADYELCSKITEANKTIYNIK